MKKIVKIDEERRKRLNRQRSMVVTESVFPRKPSRPKPRGSGRGGLAIAALLLVLALGGYYLTANGTFDRLAPLIATPPADTISVRFTICPDGQRENCVVDGDTFWLGHQKIRIADIDTPELSPPRCEGERTKGQAAKKRLLDLLNAGTFSLVADGRDADQYGRKLRTVTRNGQSIGDILIAEGLARRWDGVNHGDAVRHALRWSNRNHRNGA